MIRRIKVFLSIVSRPLLLIPFFLILYGLNSGFAYLEEIILCFPVTVITTSKGLVDEIVQDKQVCSYTTDVEKFMVDSQIFSGSAMPPVKDIYLLKLRTAYTSWKNISNMDNAITEVNPFVSDTAEYYLKNKLKLLIFSFVAAVAGAFFFLSISFYRGFLPTRGFISALTINTALYCGIALYLYRAVIIGVFMPVFLLSVSVGFILYTMHQIINHRNEVKK